MPLSIFVETVGDYEAPQTSSPIVVVTLPIRAHAFALAESSVISSTQQRADHTRLQATDLVVSWPRNPFNPVHPV